MILPRRIPLLSLIFLLACGEGGPGSGQRSGEKEKESFSLPVRVVRPSRSDVEDHVETQANLESDQQVTVLAETDGRILERLADVGDFVGGEPVGDAGEPAGPIAKLDDVGDQYRGSGKPPYLLARLDDRDQALALEDAEIHLQETQGRSKELALDVQRNAQLFEQAEGAEREAEAVFKRTSAGIADGTISLEEHETATFARNRAKTAVLIAASARDKAQVALELNAIAILKATVARDRAKLALERTLLQSRIAGVVTFCAVREGQRVKAGDAVYLVENPDSLVVYADIPVRQAARIRKGDTVGVGSTATPEATTGKVLLVEPTVNSASGTVRVKIAVKGAPGFKPGLFVSLRIVVESRADALVVPKRSVMHHDEDGAYLFLVQPDSIAARVLVKTGFERGDMIEVKDGIDAGAQVVVEGQDTLTDGARVEIME